MKKIFYAIMALAFVAAGCVNEKGLYTPPVAETGAQVYIPNAKTSYAVKTAEEKQEARKELSKIVKKAPKTLATPEDDKVVSIPIARKNANGDYECKVNLVLPEGAETLFNVTSISYKLDGVDTEDTNIVTDPGEGVLSVTFTFPDEVDKVGLNIGFDIAALTANVEYEFNLSLAEDTESSSYGTYSLDFVIVHSAPVHNPWVVIGEAELETTLYSGAFGMALNKHTATIAIHEDDFVKFELDENGKWNSNPEKWELKDQPYYRFCIPYFGAQFFSACVETGELDPMSEFGLTEEEFAEYYETSDGFCFTLDKNYNIVWDYDNATYPHPLAKDISTGTGYFLYHMFGYDHSTGNIEYNKTYAIAFVYDQILATFYMDPEYLSTSGGRMARLANGRVGYDFQIESQFVYQGGVYTMAGCGGVAFNWTKNGLIEDWENYFKVDYNPSVVGGDINYGNILAGTLKSEIKGAEGENTLYLGHDDIYGDQVYWINYKSGKGLALLENGSTVKVADHQSIGFGVNGKELFFSQSDKEASKIERDANGAITKLTLKLVAKSEDESVILYFTEEFTAGPAYSIDDILGDWTLNARSIYKMTPQEVEDPTPYVADESTTVNIVKVEGNDVRIEGIVSPGYGAPAKAYINGTFNPDNGAIEVEPQFIKYKNDNGEIKTATDGDGYYLFFQPGVTTWASEDYTAYYGVWLTSSYLYSSADYAAFNFYPEYGAFIFGNSLKANNTSYPIDGFAVECYEYNTAYASQEYQYDLYCTISQVALTRTPAPGMPAKKAPQMHKPINSREFAAKAPKQKAPAKVEFSIFNK